MSKFEYHSPESRGTTNQGWLHSRHVFSYGNYYNPDRMHFGVLRVINEDMIAPAMGYGMHPHSNMEIVTIILDGKMLIKDNFNNEFSVEKGDVWTLSAGTGIFHSELNQSRNNTLKLLQIRLLPKTTNVKPRFSKQSFIFEPNNFTEIVSPKLNGCLWLYQDAWLYFARFDTNQSIPYKLKKQQKNGVYIYILSGKIVINNTELTKGSGMGITETSAVDIFCTAHTEFLLLEIPMKNI
jgi:redox-sensitive bicupin YhaK (pirin superfamily)